MRFLRDGLESLFEYLSTSFFFFSYPHVRIVRIIEAFVLEYFSMALEWRYHNN